MTLPVDAPAGRLARSPGVKFFALGFLALLILVPLVFIDALGRERSGRAAEVGREVAQAWGGEQTIAGPFLIVPYLVEAASGAPPQRRAAIFLPDRLTVDGQAKTESLRRSIFDVAVYRGGLDFAARFRPPVVADIDARATQALWSEAILVMQVTDMRGVKNRAALKIGDGASVDFLPTTGPLLAAGPGMHAPLRGLDPARPLDVAISIELNGSRGLSIAPLGAETDIALSSNWPHPSFSGAHAPDERTVTENGFSARWRIGQLSRNFNQTLVVSGRGLETSFAPTAASVRFYQPVDIYQLVARATKYGVLFVGAVFLVVFALEMMSRGRLHVAQYAMVGLALALFYVLLLSYAEHIGFVRAYLVAAGATTSLVSAYIGLCLRSLWKGAVLAAALGVAYGLVFLLLRSEDYALLAGATAGFVGLALLMLATFRIDWSGVGQTAREAAAPARDALDDALGPPRPTASP